MPDASVLFAFSGPRASGKEDIYHEVKRLAREHHPDQPLVFVESVLKKPHPLYWSREHRAKHPTTRLVENFAEFNQAGIDLVRPSIDAGYTVVSLRYGLDVYLDSIAETDCAQAKSEAFELWHKHLVPARVVRRTPKPQYIIVNTVPDAGHAIKSFHRRQERDIAEYFDGTGQLPPIYLSSISSLEERAREALSHILAAVCARKNSFDAYA